MSYGGKREGAGRKVGVATLEREKARAYIAERVAKYMPQIFEVLLDKTLKGDLHALRELLDRAFGRPAQAVELSGLNGNPLFDAETKTKSKKAIVSYLSLENLRDRQKTGD